MTSLEVYIYNIHAVMHIHLYTHTHNSSYIRASIFVLTSLHNGEEYNSDATQTRAFAIASFVIFTACTHLLFGIHATKSRFNSVATPCTVHVNVCDLSTGGVFKSGWMDCPSEWNQPTLAAEFDAIRSLRSLVYKALSSACNAGSLRSFTESQVGITTDSEQLYRLLEKYSSKDMSEGEEREGYGLSDVFIVSRATVELGGGGVGSGVGSVFCEDGEVVWGGKRCQVSVEAWRAEEMGKHKCPRCWLWTANSQDQLCLRCSHVHI